MTTGKRTSTTYGALDAFFPGVLALSGDSSAHNACRSPRSGCGTCMALSRKNSITKTMTVKHAGYPLRPEIVESTYYLYQYTQEIRVTSQMGESHVGEIS